MIPKAPKIDSRAEKEIFQEALSNMKDRLDINFEQDHLATAILRVFARYCGLIIQRLNQVPDKNHVAFLDMLNVSRIPPVPAQVPLTFTPVKTLPKSPTGIVVPARTKVAAPPGEGEPESAVFETLFNVSLTNIAIKKIVAVDSENDRYSDKSALGEINGKTTAQFAFSADNPIDHVFYLGLTDLGKREDIRELRVQFEMAPGSASGLLRHKLEWFIPTPDGKVLLLPHEDTTQGLKKSGNIVFKNLPQWPSHSLCGHNLPWLGCRCLDFSANDKAEKNAQQFPVIKKVKITASWDFQDGLPTGLFFNNLPIDFSRDFFPFGQRPQFGDLFYLNCDLFEVPRSEIVMKIKMTNPVSGTLNASLPPVTRKGDPRVRWEYWNGHHWDELDCRDETSAFTKDGQVSFVIPTAFKCTIINGLEGAWIRARLISGNYGHEERFEFNNTEQRLYHIPSTLAPPCFQTIAIASSFSSGPNTPEWVVSNNNLTLKPIDGGKPFQPFYGSTEAYKGLYLGLRVPEGDQDKWIDHPLDLYFHIKGTEGRAYVYDSDDQARLIWQYWNGKDWIVADTKDGTRSLNRSGMVSISCGAEIAPWTECGIEGGSNLYWLRLLWTQGRFECHPKLERILLNTVPATQTMTLENELLGSSSGRPHQFFYLSRLPIIDDVQLLVREPEMPSEEELVRIYGHKYQDAVFLVRSAQNEIEKIWIRWKQMDESISSGIRDRHFVVDRQSGKISFGDGKRGLIPPPGLNNLLLQRYQTGGGAFGNKSAGCVTQLRESVVYVDSVVNLEAARGGQNVEGWDSVINRGGRWLRHRNRAVTLEDYEDLAGLAAPNVAKAKCYPNRNLASLSKDSTIRPGVVSLVIVSQSSDRKPLPDLDLLLQVKEFIDQHRPPDAELVVLAPEYVELCVESVVVTSAASISHADILSQCRLALDNYLHPLTGGEDGNGWAFGERPHESDIYSVLESIRGLEYVSALDIRMKEDSPDILKKGIFLIASGDHTIRLGG